MVFGSVSVVIPVFDTDHDLLEKCVNSVMSQDYKAVEVVIVDDGSCDETARFCDSFSRKGALVLHKPNGGLSSARNYGVQCSTGEYLYFLDSDDFLYSSDSISALMGKAQISEDVEVVVGEYHFSKYTERLENPIDGKAWLRDCLRTGAASFPATDTVYKRCLLERLDHLFVEGLIHEDEEFTPRVLLEAKSVVGLSSKKTYSRVPQANSITSSKDQLAIFRRCEGKMRGACMLLSYEPFKTDERILKGIALRAYGFVNAAFKIWAKSSFDAGQQERLYSLAAKVDFSACPMVFSDWRSVRTCLCMKMVRAIGVRRFVRILSALGR